MLLEDLGPPRAVWLVTCIASEVIRGNGVAHGGFVANGLLKFVVAFDLFVVSLAVATFVALCNLTTAIRQ